MNKIAILFITMYRATISKLKGGKKCIYTPSCSIYGIESYSQHGFFKATALTLSRIFRCAPWGKGGIDYVPVKLTGRAKWYL